MIDKGPPPKPTVPCPVCDGAGWWDRLTGKPLQHSLGANDVTRCPLCEGTGVQPERSPRL